MGQKIEYSELLSLDPYHSKVKARYISYLKKRVSQCNGDFPHEIGVFLGYPVEDVTGFIKNKGKSFKLNGYWKVYGDEKKASHMFRRYTECRDSLCRKLSQGISLESALGLAS